MPQVGCKICSKEFYIKPNRLKRGWGSYCSNACHYEGMHNGETYRCAACGTAVYRTPGELRKSKAQHFFCNKRCFMIWKNQHLLIGYKHGNWKGGEGCYRDIMRRAAIPPICHDCGSMDRRVLLVHHIDRNRKNNKLNNLRWLCRNCHYIEHGGKTV